MREFVEAECPMHGLDRHFEVHEAGHAVAAIDNEIPFSHIALYGEDDRPTWENGLLHAPAAVEMLSQDQSTWALPDPGASLRFVMAGSLAEAELLGHAIEGGWDEDMRAWRRGMKRTGAMMMDEWEPVLGAPFPDFVRDTQSWAKTNATRIERLAKHLATLARPGQMQYEDVKSFLSQS